MTKTPRTDAVTCGKGYGIPGNTVSADFARELERELMLANSIIKSGIKELNQWRECANKLADCNLKTVPLICLEPHERSAISMLENLNRSAAMPNATS